MAIAALTNAGGGTDREACAAAVIAMRR